MSSRICICICIEEILIRLSYHEYIKDLPGRGPESFMFLVSLVYATLLCKPATQMETAAGTLAKFQPLAIGWISAAKMCSVMDTDCSSISPTFSRCDDFMQEEGVHYLKQCKDCFVTRLHRPYIALPFWFSQNHVTDMDDFETSNSASRRTREAYLHCFFEQFNKIIVESCAWTRLLGIAVNLGFFLYIIIIITSHHLEESKVYFSNGFKLFDESFSFYPQFPKKGGAEDRLSDSLRRGGTTCIQKL